MEESKDKEKIKVFDDKELEKFTDEEVEIDEGFEKEMSKKIDDYLEENPIEYE